MSVVDLRKSLGNRIIEIEMNDKTVLQTLKTIFQSPVISLTLNQSQLSAEF